MRGRLLGLTVALMLVVLGASTRAVALPTGTVELLERSPYVYIATERKGGGLGAPAEIWFMWHDGAVWVASPPTTWRVRRIKAGRPTARIAVGTKDGPTFTARGALVHDPATYERLFTTYAKKYPDGWPKYEARFRDGLKDGSRVLVRYAPVADAAESSPVSGAATTESGATPKAGAPSPAVSPSSSPRR